MFGKVIKGIGVALVVVLLFGVIIASVTKKPNYAEKIWDEQTITGVAPEEVQHHFIMYTDIMCPYCSYATRLMIDNDEEFQQYLKDHNITFEVRMTDFLYEFGAHQINNSREGGEAIYCAKNDGKFWDYYHAAVDQIWNDYIVNGVGSSSTAPPIADLDTSYWLAIGEKAGLTESFKDCYTSRGSLTELQNNTARAYDAVESGLPQFYFDNYSFSGFDPNWGWADLLQMFDAGLKSSR